VTTKVSKVVSEFGKLYGNQECIYNYAKPNSNPNLMAIVGGGASGKSLIYRKEQKY